MFCFSQWALYQNLANAENIFGPFRFCIEQVSLYAQNYLFCFEEHFIFFLKIPIEIIYFAVNDNTQKLLPWTLSAVAVSYALFVTFLLYKKKGKVNNCIEQDSSKVVHTIDIEDIGKKVVMCRCWKSQKVFCNSLFYVIFIHTTMFGEILFSSLSLQNLISSSFKLMHIIYSNILFQYI